MQARGQGSTYFGVGRGGGALIGIFLFCLQINGQMTREGLLSGSLR